MRGSLGRFLAAPCAPPLYFKVEQIFRPDVKRPHVVPITPHKIFVCRRLRGFRKYEDIYSILLGRSRLGSLNDAD